MTLGLSCRLKLINVPRVQPHGADLVAFDTVFDPVSQVQIDVTQDDGRDVRIGRQDRSAGGALPAGTHQ
jgi:hypothetical protein